MSDDILSRLQQHGEWKWCITSDDDGLVNEQHFFHTPICVEAAAEIERLREHVEQLQSAYTFIDIWKDRCEQWRQRAEQLEELGERMYDELDGLREWPGGRGDQAMDDWEALHPQEASHE